MKELLLTMAQRYSNHKQTKVVQERISLDQVEGIWQQVFFCVPSRDLPPPPSLSL